MFLFKLEPVFFVGLVSSKARKYKFVFICVCKTRTSRRFSPSKSYEKDFESCFKISDSTRRGKVCDVVFSLLESPMTPN
jgi:hypothetical protein